MIENKRSIRKYKLLTIIPYKFLPAKLGGHLAHLHFHNFISKYIDSIVVGSKSNQYNDEGKNDVNFRLLSVLGNKHLTYSQLYYLSKLFSIIENEKVNAILCSHPYLGLTSYILSKKAQIPLVLYSHNIESERFRTLNKWWWRLLFVYEKWVMQHSDIIFFVTEDDKKWAIKNYGLTPNKCIVSPFGINISEKPFKPEQYRANLCNQLGVTKNTKIMYFAGSYNYRPNDEAVEYITDEIAPRLIKKYPDFIILIIGKGLNAKLQDKILQTNGKVVYLGFVEDINEVLFSADIMLNPMLTGGGIKTKAVEALGNNLKVVSTKNGSFGLDSMACHGMLWVSKDKDWDGFVENIVLAADSEDEIDDKFYDFYYWGNVTKRVVEEISRIS